MRKRLRSKDHDDNVDRWMVSYADFVTLLFCFFTAMYAISSVDTNKLGKFVESMRTAFNTSNESGGKGVSLIEGVQVFIPADVQVESDVKEVLGKLLSENGINVTRDKRGVVISVKDKSFFGSGSVVFKDDAEAVLDKIASALKKFPNMIRIEGHTDNVPINNEKFPSNWELSATRAIKVAKYLIKIHNIQPGKISTAGYAEYRPVASNDTPEGRTRNRRVDIVIMSEAESKKEP